MSSVDDSSRRGIGRRLLYGRDADRMRATWRVAITFAIAIAIYYGGQLLVRSLPGVLLDSEPTGGAVIGLTLALLLALTLVIGVSAVVGLLVASRVDQRSIASYGLDRSGRWGREFFVGVLIGVVAVAGAITYQAARGYTTVRVDVTGVGVDSALVGGVTLLVMLAFYLVNNVFEEILFRAVLIKNAAEGLRARSVGTATAVAAAFAVSLPVFGLLHLLGGGLADVVTSAVAGVLFATAYVLTGRLALPVGVHFGGVAIASAFQEPVSADPELTLPSLVVVEGGTDPSLLVATELWIVRMVFGVVLILAWVYASSGEISIDERVYAWT